MKQTSIGLIVSLVTIFVLAQVAVHYPQMAAWLYDGDHPSMRWLLLIPAALLFTLLALAIDALVGKGEP